MADFTKLWVVFIFLRIIFLTASYSISEALFSFIDDLDSLGTYGGSYVIYSFLHQQILGLAYSVHMRNMTGRDAFLFNYDC